MRLGLALLAREMGLGLKPARKQLRKVRHLYPPVGTPPTWDPRCLDLLRALRGQPHRTLEPVELDWLTAYVEGPTDAPSPPCSPRPP